jgi:hypothetical protein
LIKRAYLDPHTATGLGITVTRLQEDVPEPGISAITGTHHNIGSPDQGRAPRLG